jgi:hypothetical protein
MPRYLESQFNQNAPAGFVKANWWDQPKKEVHKALIPLMASLEHEQRHRDYLNRIYLSLFVGQGLIGLKGNQYAIRHRNTGQIDVNLARRIASAANSKLAKNKVRILHLTEGGNWSQQTRAKRMTKVVNGTFHSTNFYRENARAQLDSCIFDVGAVRFWREREKVCCEKVPGHEIRVDYMDARYGKPSQLHREMVVPRNKLIAQFPKHRELIKYAPHSDGTRQSGSRWVVDCVDVTMSWHLPSEEGGKDGMVAMVLPNGTLSAERYTHNYFPFVFHFWEQNPLGFYGQSICSQILGIQYNLRNTVQDIQDHVDLSTGFVVAEPGANFNKQALTNEVWRILETSGPVQYIAPPAFQRDKLDWVNWLINQGHEDTGLSQLFVTSRKPDGLDSGKALREYNDQNSERFQQAEQRYEETYVAADKIICGLYEEAYEELGNFPVQSSDNKVIQTIDWEAARMDGEDYVVRPVPTSFLPSTPAAKLQTIQEMLQAGLFGREEAMLLLDYPDLERVNTLAQAPLLNIEWRLEKMLDPDEPAYYPPEPTMNLSLAMKLASSAYNDAQVSGAPDENLELILRFMAQIEKMIEDAQAPPPQAAAPPMAEPPMEGPPIPGGNGAALPPEAMIPPGMPVPQ